MSRKKFLLRNYRVHARKTHKVRLGPRLVIEIEIVIVARHQKTLLAGFLDVARMAGHIHGCSRQRGSVLLPRY